MSLRDDLRLSYVPRWVIVPMLRPQTVSDHSWRVAMIAAALIKDIVRHDGTGSERPLLPAMAPVVITAIQHDLGEVYTGDTPSPNKPMPDWASLNDVDLVVKVADVIESVSWADSWVHPDARVGVMEHYRDRWAPMVSELDRRYPGSRKTTLELLKDLCLWRKEFGLW